MENDQRKDTFTYTYSAKERNEINNIRKKYMPAEEDKMERLRRLDASTTKKGTVVSLVVGIIGALIMGIGLCGTMMWQGLWFIFGIVIGVIGIGISAVACPLYIHITNKERERIAPEIIRLTDELMK